MCVCARLRACVCKTSHSHDNTGGGRRGVGAQQATAGNRRQPPQATAAGERTKAVLVVAEALAGGTETNGDAVVVRRRANARLVGGAKHVVLGQVHQHRRRLTHLAHLTLA